MNKSLVEKILNRLTLSDLYEEIKDNDQLILALGIVLAKKKPSIFISIIREFVERHVKNEGNESVRKFLKEEIINMDGTESVSINETVKRKVSTTNPKPSTISDPCSRGGGRISSC